MLGPFWCAVLLPVVLLWALERGAPGPGAAALAGLLSGVVAQALGLWWVWPLGLRFFSLSAVTSALLALAFFVFQGWQHAILWGLLAHLRRRGISAVAALVPCLLAVEQLYPTHFPSRLGLALHGQVWRCRSWSSAGPLASALLAMSGVALYVAVAERGRGLRPRAYVSVALIAWAGTVGHGFLSVERIEARMAAAEALHVGLVQAATGPEARLAEPAENLTAHLALSRRVTGRRPPPDLVVWPDTALLRVDDPGAVAAQVPAPLVFGGVERAAGRVYNAAFFHGRPDASPHRYRKRRLLAFGEYVPLADLLPWPEGSFPRTAGFSPGAPGPLPRLRGAPFAILICYEDVLSDFVREVVEAGRPQLLVDISNDGWFGDTPEPWLHMALSRFRAVEHRLYLACASQTGVSGVIDPLGRTRVDSDVGQRVALHARAGLLAPSSWYARVGPWPGHLACVSVAWLLLVRRRRPRPALPDRPRP